MLLAFSVIIAAYFVHWSCLLRTPFAGAVTVFGCYALNMLCVFRTAIPFDTSVICNAQMCAKVSDVPHIKLDTPPKPLKHARPLPNEDKPRRNFALLSGGAKVIPELTSLTKDLPRHGRLANLLVWARGHDISDTDVNLPTIVLEGGRNNHGECWEFHGNQGHIAIQLSGLAYISDIGIYHAPPGVISYADSMKIPKNITLWGLSTEALRSLPVAGNNETHSHLRIPSNFVTIDHRPIAYPILPSDIFVPLWNFQYNSTIGGLQYFLVPEDAHIDYIAFNLVVIEIHSNSGSESTCLHQIIIHGAEV